MSDINEKLDMRVSKETKDLYIKVRGKKRNNDFLKELLIKYNGLDVFKDSKQSEYYCYSITKNKYITDINEVSDNINNIIVIGITKDISLDDITYRMFAIKIKFENRHKKLTYTQETSISSKDITVRRDIFKDRSFDEVATYLRKNQTESLVNGLENYLHFDITRSWDREKFENKETIFTSQATKTISYLEIIKKVLNINNNEIIKLINPIDPY